MVSVVAHYSFPLSSKKTCRSISELLIALGRHDVHNLVDHFLDNNLVDANFVDYLYSSEWQLISEEIKSALLSSTSVSLYDAFKKLMSMIIEDSPFLPIYSHAALDTYCHGTTPSKRSQETTRFALFWKHMPGSRPSF